ncbi:MAG: hypothetical protein QXV60_03545 [Nitrososphaerota archaeon]
MQVKVEVTYPRRIELDGLAIKLDWIVFDFTNANLKQTEKFANIMLQSMLVERSYFEARARQAAEVKVVDIGNTYFTVDIADLSSLATNENVGMGLYLVLKSASKDFEIHIYFTNKEVTESFAKYTAEILKKKQGLE